MPISFSDYGLIVFSCKVTKDAFQKSISSCSTRNYFCNEQFAIGPECYS